MKLREEQLVETESNFDNDDEIIVEVAKDEADKLFSILLENYKNARTAMIREYVSNAWDAHKEINSDEPVVVRIDYDDGGWFLEIIDKGVGMTEDFVKKTFSQLLKSTKSNNNNAIGAFGIGSKTALAYTNQFQLSTVKDGFKNEYLVYRETSGSPKILPTIVNQETNDLKSGTTIKIYLIEKNHSLSYDEREQIIGNRYSSGNISEANYIAYLASKELSFFDNVIFNFPHFKSIENDYNNGKIIEGNTFKYRTSSKYSNDLHLLLGKVAYPVDWKEIGMSSINIPIGVKFEIGDFMVGMTRENITYSDETKALIEKKIKSTLDELIKRYNDGNQPIEDIREYVTTIKDFEKYPTYNIKFVIDEDTTYQLNISDIKGFLNPPVFAPIKDLPLSLSKGETPYFFLYSPLELSDNYKRTNKSNLRNITHSNFDTKLVFLKTNVNPDNALKNRYLKNCLFIRDYNHAYKKMCSELHIEKVTTGIKEVENTTRWEKKETYYQVGSGKLIYDYKKIIINELKKVFTWIDYDTFEVPQEYIEEQKRLVKENKIKKEKLDGVISIKDIDAVNTGYSNHKPSKQYDLKLSTLNNFTGTIIYGFREDAEDLQKVRELLVSKKEYGLSIRETILEETKDSGWGRSGRKYSTYGNVDYLNDKIIRVYCISRSNAKVFKNKHFKAYHITEIMQVKQIQRFLTSMMISRNKNLSLKQGDVKLFNERIGTLIQQVSKYYADNSTTRHENILRELLEKFSNSSNLELSMDAEIKYKIKLIDDYFKDAELIRYVNISNESLPYVVDYLKDKKKPVNLKFYNQGKGIEITEKQEEEQEKVIQLVEREHEDLTKYWEKYSNSIFIPESLRLIQ